MSRRALLAAAVLVLTGDAPTGRPPTVVHTGPARQSAWYPGKPRPHVPDWLYENGLDVVELAVARTVTCACSHPPT